MRRLLVRGGSAIAIALFAGIYFFVDPAETAWAPKCLFHAVTGLQCSGCGSQRAVHALLHGDIAAAFRYNALLITSLPFIIVALWTEISRKSHPRLYAAIHNVWCLSIVAIIVVVWTIVRNIIGV